MNKKKEIASLPSVARNDREEERILRKIPLEILALSFIMALASLPFFSTLTAIFILAGGGFSALSFIWLKRSVSSFLFSIEKDPINKTKALKSGLSLYLLRFVLILAILLIIILLFSRKIIAFAVGYSALIPVCFGEAIAVFFRMKQWKS